VNCPRYDVGFLFPVLFFSLHAQSFLGICTDCHLHGTTASDCRNLLLLVWQKLRPSGSSIFFNIFLPSIENKRKSSSLQCNAAT